MLAHPSTIAVETRAGASKASPSAFRSFLTLDYHQADAAASRPLGHGRVYPCQFQTPASTPVLPGAGRLPVGAFIAAAGSFIRQTIGSRRWLDISLRNEPSVKLARYAAIPHRLSLSQKSVLVGFDPNENGLTHGTEALSPDDKIHD